MTRLFLFSERAFCKQSHLIDQINGVGLLMLNGPQLAWVYRVNPEIKATTYYLKCRFLTSATKYLPTTVIVLRSLTQSTYVVMVYSSCQYSIKSPTLLITVTCYLCNLATPVRQCKPAQNDPNPYITLLLQYPLYLCNLFTPVTSLLV